MRRDPPSRCSLLVRNLHKETRESDLRYFAEKYGPVRDVYLPRDYYSGEARGIGFIEYTNPRDAEDAKYQMDKMVLLGREVSVVFAMQGRKRPDDYRRGYRGGGVTFCRWGKSVGSCSISHKEQVLVFLVSAASRIFNLEKVVEGAVAGG